MAKISAEGSLRDPNISVELPDGCWLTKNLDVTADTNDIFNTKTVIIGIIFLKKIFFRARVYTRRKCVYIVEYIKGMPFYRIYIKWYILFSFYP